MIFAMFGNVFLFLIAVGIYLAVGFFKAAREKWGNREQ